MAVARRRTARSSLLHVDDGVAWLSLPRERVDQAIAQAVCDAAEQIAFDESIRVAVVQGRGRRFCVGIEDGGAWETAHDWVEAVAALSVPVIAALAGDALAEGAELALACDLQVASAGARIGFPQVVEGRLPGHGATQRLPRAVGRMRGLDLLLSGRRVGAREAQRIGLISHVVPAAQLDATLRALTKALCAKGPVALRLAKEAVRKGSELTLDQGIRLEQDLYVLLQTTADRAEGVRAFLRKRKPTFRGL
jgi:enoyl-CoA hydratase/carnithine racemase